MYATDYQTSALDAAIDYHRRAAMSARIAAKRTTWISRQTKLIEEARFHDEVRAELETERAKRGA
jgi:hypothetical protein